MAEARTETRRFSCFFLYDRSKVQEEGDLTRAGICYFYPEDTPLEDQELLCGQLAGVSRCVSELSRSPVRLLRLRKSKYAVRMRDPFLWALNCVAEIPDISVCEFLDQLIDLFCFYNGPVQQSYQLHSRGELALRWARCLSHLQGGTTELHHIFSCLNTVDSTRIDPLLLLKAALILQACQRCPLVLAGCLLYQGRVLSTQMPPELTRKVMVQETETYSQEDGLLANGVCLSGATPSSSTVTTTVFLTSSELHVLQCHPVDNSCRCHCTPQPPDQPRKTRLLSRTLSDIPTTELDPAELDSAYCPPPVYQTMSSPPSSSSSASYSLCPSTVSSLNSTMMSETERTRSDSQDHSLPNGTLPYKVIESVMCESGSPIRSEDDRNEAEGLEAEGLEVTVSNTSGQDSSAQHIQEVSEGVREEVTEVSDEVTEVRGEVTEVRETEVSGVERRGDYRSPSQAALVPLLLYQHRVRGLVLSLLVERHFSTDDREDVCFSSLASLNGLEAHLRTASTGLPGPLGPPGAQGPYVFTHYDCIQNTLTTNVSGHSRSQDPFVKATALLHSHFSHMDTLQEAIVRNASGAVYATRTTAQETYFLQQGASARNSGIPSVQDSAFSLPSKARRRLLKHGVNLL
ncbi:BLOC-3 complex member HPS4 isoform X1 [Brachyhypopomus gauderio]|uniref:BLOC-3 complex member HPS4 isoform X1 n=2 Tax=Brachyhypopomus gauderio TaxID=698409 RepID=UPI004041F406